MPPMQKTVQSVVSVSLPFFIILGFTHLASVFLIAQGVVSRLDWLLFNILDLPFLLAGLLYGLGKLALLLEETTGNLKVPLAVCTGAGVVVFVLALYFNFGLTDVPIG